jgi:hypothetical protein
MTKEQLDKVMKPYWESKFDSTELRELNGNEDDWFGFILNNDIIVGCPTKDLSDGTWFYSGSNFVGGADLFGLDISGFRLAMVRYLNKTYNLNIKSIL